MVRCVSEGTPAEVDVRLRRGPEGGEEEAQMNLEEAVTKACEMPTLVDALTYIAIWETERVVKQARENSTWTTCFKVCFDMVLDRYGK